MEYVYCFFYGSLLEGGYNHSTVPIGSKKIRRVTLPFKLYQTPFGYPAITQERGTVVGDIYRVPKEGFIALDRLEGFRSPGNPDNLYERKKILFDNQTIFLYFAGAELTETIKNYNVVIVDGDWLKFYNTTWKEFEDPSDHEIEGSFSKEDLLEVCKEFGVDSIKEVNMLLESAYRRDLMLEASDKKDKNKPSLDDLNEPEDIQVEEPIGVDVADEEEEDEQLPTEPSLGDLDEPEGEEEEEPTTEEPTKEEIPTPSAPAPVSPEIPSSTELPPEDKKAEPQVSYDWKKEKHLRTLYNNFFKVYPKRGSSTSVEVDFNSVKANALHPEGKYLQANITSMCTSEDPEKVGQYYSQWIQLRRQRNTQEWTVDLPCEVRCDCKTFIYKLAYANIRNKSFAGSVVTKGVKDGYPINYRIPSNETNPNYTPALCKHLMGLTNEIFDVAGDGKVRKDLVI